MTGTGIGVVAIQLHDGPGETSQYAGDVNYDGDGDGDGDGVAQR